VIRDLPLRASNWRMTETLDEFLRRGKIVAIAGIDTRKLTRILREKGAQAGCIMTATRRGSRRGARGAVVPRASRAWISPRSSAVARSYQWNEGSSFDRKGTARSARTSGCMSSPTISASSATSCGCSPTRVAA
jgi:carbamoyl-phosphate synthase small subunit